MKPTLGSQQSPTGRKRGAGATKRVRGSLLLGAICAALGLTHVVHAAPEKLAIFYGPPKKVNGAHRDPNDSYATKIAKAAAVFDDYDLVIFPEKAELPSTDPNDPEPDLHTSTRDIIQALPSTTRVYGYVDLCVQNPVSELYRCRNHSMQTLKDRVDSWATMGAKGIFLDQAGCDYLVSRNRQNEIVDYIHSKNLSAFVNVWEQKYAFSAGPLPSPYDNPDTLEKEYPDCNPDLLQTHLGPNDYTLLESWAVMLSDYMPGDNPMLLARADEMLGYKNQYGTKVATVNTVAIGNPQFDQRQLDYTWWTTALYGFDAMAWGETWIYSADSHELPFRQRPTANLGTPITPVTVTHNGDLHSRTTSTGTILVDVAGGTGRLAGKNTVAQPAFKPTDLRVADANFTATHVTLTAGSHLAPIGKFQFFIDSDDNPATGFLHADEGITTVGADYMVDNEDVYVFNGANQTTWSWQLVAPVTPTGVNSTSVSVTVPLAQIGYTSGTRLRLLAKSSTNTWKALDFLPRAPAALWQAKPSPIQQAGTQPTDLVKADVSFSQYQRTVKMTFHIDSNGGPITGYRALIDADNNAATGHNFWSLNVLGADYLLEHGTLHRFIGADTTPDWTWTPISAVPELAEPDPSPKDGLNTPHIRASILPERIGFEPGEEISVVLQHGMAQEPYTEFDFLPRVVAGFTPWKISYNAAQQEAGPDTLVSGDTAFSSNAVSFTIRSNGGPINSYRIFIDRDNSSSTGYRHTAVGIAGTGAEYMVQDGKLYQFCGATQGAWCWSFLSNNVTDAGYGSAQVTVEVPKTSISYVAGSTLALVGENFVSSKESLDHLIRSSATTWRATP